MNILHVHWYYPPQVGGVETLLQLWVEKLQARGHRVTLLAASLSQEDMIHEENEAKIVRWACFDPKRRDKRYLVQFRESLRRFLLANNFDIIHLHNLFSPLTPWRTICLFEMGARLNIPMLMHAHCRNDTEMGKLLISLGWDDVLFISEWLKREFLGYGLPLQRTDIIYNGVRTDYFQKEKANREKAREEMGVSGDLPVILWPARIVNPDGKPTARKKLDTLLRASALVKRKNLRFKLLILAPSYGDKNMRDRCLEEFGELMEAENLRKNIILLPPRLSYTLMRDVYAGSDIMCQPSVNEPFGLVFIEAMAMEKVAVGARSGALPEIIDHGEDGFLIEPDNHEELAELLIQLIQMDKKDREAIGKRAREKAKSKFSLEKMIDDTERIYNKFVD